MTTLEWHGSTFYVRRWLSRSQRSFKPSRPSQKMLWASKYIIFAVTMGEVSMTTSYSRTYLLLVASPSNCLLHTLKTRIAWVSKESEQQLKGCKACYTTQAWAKASGLKHATWQTTWSTTVLQKHLTIWPPMRLGMAQSHFYTTYNILNAIPISMYLQQSAPNFRQSLTIVLC